MTSSQKALRFFYNLLALSLWQASLVGRMSQVLSQLVAGVCLVGIPWQRTLGVHTHCIPYALPLADLTLIFSPKQIFPLKMTMCWVMSSPPSQSPHLGVTSGAPIRGAHTFRAIASSWPSLSVWDVPLSLVIYASPWTLLFLKLVQPQSFLMLRVYMGIFFSILFLSYMWFEDIYLMSSCLNCDFL